MAYFPANMCGGGYKFVDFQSENSSYTVAANFSSATTIHMNQKVGSDDLTGYSPIAITHFLIGGTPIPQVILRGYTMSTDGTGGYIYLVSPASSQQTVTKAGLQMTILFKKD